MHHKSPHFSHLFFKLSQQFIFKHISTLCSMTFHIYKNTICIGKWLLIESAISWMQVYLAAWVFSTSFGSMPLLFHGHFLIGQMGWMSLLSHAKDIYEFSVGIVRSHLHSVSCGGWWAWSTKIHCCLVSLKMSLEGGAIPPGPNMPTAGPPHSVPYPCHTFLSHSAKYLRCVYGFSAVEDIIHCNSVIISEPSLDAHNPQAVTLITELQTSTTSCLMAELTRANWSEISRL